MNDLEGLREKLRAALARNPDAYQMIGAATGLGKTKVTLVAEGKLAPTMLEFAKLEVLA
jgi:hypothetical protein